MPSQIQINRERWHWHIRGQVQGVGFRPFVFRVATHAGVTGRVFNDASGVHLEVQGSEDSLAAFESGFHRDMPPLAKVESCQRSTVDIVAGERGFVIEASPPSEPDAPKPADAAVTVDTAVCADCLREMRTPADRRHGHALINCTNCGPRFSIIRAVPYDRKNTTMAPFALCPECRREYHSPINRRFHAQPVCCKSCGPKVELVRISTQRGGKGPAARRIPGNPFTRAAELLSGGKILAIKGLGGFHLAVRADDESALSRLRAVKHRDAKPFAIMCRDIARARGLVQLSDAGEVELTGPRAPIVLAPRRRGHLPIAPSVAPGTNLLGVMLPYTPIHFLLWDALGDSPAALVMTSGNLSQEPLIIDNDDALQRLGGLCDAILWHDRPIERCVDDTVILDRGPARAVLPIRRSRGYAPGVFIREGQAPQTSGICVGGELKSTVAVVRSGEIIVSQHLGDLTDARSYAHFRKAIDDLVQLFNVRVDFVVHDLHPNYMSTIAARELAQQHHARLIGLQHHAAHAFAVMGEHRISNALALVCDGTGYGTDGTIWGGELLEVKGGSWHRVGRLKLMRLAGGDAAARDGRRAALSLLANAFGPGFEALPEAIQLVESPADRRLLAKMINAGISSPWTSSTGRLFDGIAALLGLCHTNQHEAQAPMALEAAAWYSTSNLPIPEEGVYELRQSEEGLWELDLSPFVRWMVGGLRAGETTPASWARAFHRVLAEGWVALASVHTGEGAKKLPLVVSGGTFCNRLLEHEVRLFASQKCYRTFFHELYPPTDAGLAFGQANYTQYHVLTPTT